MIHLLTRAYIEALAKSHARPDLDALQRATFVAYRAWGAAGCPLYADPPPNTVPVRIAVSVSPDGAWSAAGGSGLRQGWTDADTLADIEHGPGDRLTWITAHVPLPEPAAVVAGEVE